MSQKTDLQSNNIDLQSILNTINNLPEAGSGGSGGVEYEIITIPAGATSGSVKYTLPRVTAAYGSVSSFMNFKVEDGSDPKIAISVSGTELRVIDYVESTPFGEIDIEVDSYGLYYATNKTITWDSTELVVLHPITLMLINDPTAPAISS